MPELSRAIDALAGDDTNNDTSGARQRPYRKELTPVITNPKSPVSERAEETRAALANARSLVIARRDQLEAATEAVETIKASWSRGDTTSTPEDLVKAEATVTYQAALLAAAEADVTRSERGLINDDDTLAALITPAIEALIPGVPVEVYTVGGTHPVKARPVARMFQTKRVQRDTINGTVTGSVEVVLHFPAWASAPVLTVNTLRKALAGIGLGNVTENDIDTSSVETTEDGATHRATINLRHVCEPVPVIAYEPKDSDVQTFAKVLSDVMAQRMAHPVTGKPQGYAPPARYSLVSTTTDKDGKRTTVAQVDYLLRPSGADIHYVGRVPKVNPSAYTRNDVRAACRNVLADSVDTRTMSGLGRVTAVDIKESPEGLGVTFTFTSRVA